MQRILSLGAGVQSTTLLLMSINGDLPLLDGAVFADTGWEPEPVYHHLEWLRGIATGAGIPIHTVSAGNLRSDTLAGGKWKRSNGNGFAQLPFYTVDHRGSRSMAVRQCTSQYKIVPILRKLREIAGLKPRGRSREVLIEQWLGISRDEAHRMRDAAFPWIINRYPLIELSMTRGGCLQWLHQHGYPEPPRSACCGCPFRSDREWRWLRDHCPEQWTQTVADDAHFRSMDARYEQYLHKSYTALDAADFGDDQRDLWGNECSGYCGV